MPCRGPEREWASASDFRGALALLVAGVRVPVILHLTHVAPRLERGDQE